MHYQCYSSKPSLAVIGWLLQEGANPNVCDPHKRTPLQLACRYGNTSTVKFLLECKKDGFERVNLDLTDADGRTSLYKVSL